MPRHQPAPTAYEVMFSIVTLAYHLQRLFDQSLAGQPLPLDISGAQTRALFEIAQAKGIRLGQLAAKLGVTARTITGVVRSLEKKGYVERIADEADKRATLIKATAIVYKRIETAKAMQREQSERLFKLLAPQQRRELFDLLNLVRESANIQE